MRIIAAKVVKKYWNIVDDTPLTITLVVGGADVIAGHVIVIRDFTVVGTVWIEWTAVSVADATHNGVVVRLLLIRSERPHSDVDLQVFNNLSLPSDELVEELRHSVLAGVDAELAVECLNRRTQ